MATIYVSTSGDNANSGASSGQAKRTIQAGINAAGSGDIVQIAAGTYNETDISPKSNITIRGTGSTEVLHGLTLRAPGGTIVDGGNSSDDMFQAANLTNLTIENIEMRNSGGAFVSIPLSSRVTLRRLLIHNCVRSGIILREGDLHLVEECHVYQCAKQQPGAAGNAITILRATDRSGSPPASWGGFRTIVRRCYTHNNVPTAGPITDGGGLAWDGAADNQVDYTGPWLFEGNVVVDNGGSGIRIIWAKDGTVRQNTCVSNCDDPRRTSDFGAGIQMYRSRHLTFESNICYEDNPENSTHAFQDTSAAIVFGEDRPSTHTNNIYRGPGSNHVIRRAQFNGPPGTLPTAEGGNLIGTDPRFVSFSGRNLALAANSPARGKGIGGSYPHAGAVQDSVVTPTDPLTVDTAPVITATTLKSGESYTWANGTYTGGSGTLTRAHKSQTLEGSTWTDVATISGGSGTFPSVTVAKQFRILETGTRGSETVENPSLQLTLQPADEGGGSTTEERLDELEANMTDARNRIATLETSGDQVARQAAADAQSASTTNAERIDELQIAVNALQTKLSGLGEDEVLQLVRFATLGVVQN